VKLISLSSSDPCQTFGWFFPGMGRVYYLFYLIFSISIYITQMHTQRYVILKKNTCFITLDIFLKYPYPKSSNSIALGVHVLGSKN
jgi:hypothetical protein